MINIKKELKNAGIKPIEQLSVQEKASIAEKIAIELAGLGIESVNYKNTLEKIFNVQMYRAKINSNSRKAIYFYKNKTIYFDEKLQLGNLNEDIIYSCIKYLQDNEIQARKGLCTTEQYKIKGEALNEAGINYISNKLLNKNNENKIYILLKQIILITGEQAFLESIFNSNDKFEKKFIDQIGSEDLYLKLQNSFDTISNLKQIISRLNNEGKESKNPQNYLRKINMHKHTINTTFSKIQWEIYSRYFTQKIENIHNAEEAKKYKNEIFSYNKLIEISEDELKYTNFTSEKLNKIQSHSSNSMVLVENKRIQKILSAIKRIIFNNKKKCSKRRIILN